MVGNYPKKIEVRGEIIFPTPAFEELNKQRKSIGLPLFANPRNMPLALLKLQDSAEVAKRNLDCFLYAVYMKDSIFNNASDQYNYLQQLGFKTPSLKDRYIQKVSTIDDIMDFINYWDDKRKISLKLME